MCALAVSDDRDPANRDAIAYAEEAVQTARQALG
jgi:hypothetical protein